MRIKVENNDITILKDCRQCVHNKTCKFLEAANNFAKQNLMYEMNPHLESNNIKEVFKTQVKCSHYKCDIKKGNLDLTYPRELLMDIFSREANKRNIDVLSYSVDLKNGIVKASVLIGERYTANNSVKKEFDLNDFIKNYKVI